MEPSLRRRMPGPSGCGQVRRDVPDMLPDIIAEHLAVLFCGINPGHAGRSHRPSFCRQGESLLAGDPSRRFHRRGIAPENDRMILQYGCGLTSVVKRPTAAADQLSRAGIRGCRRRPRAEDCPLPASLRCLSRQSGVRRTVGTTGRRLGFAAGHDAGRCHLGAAQSQREESCVRTGQSRCSLSPTFPGGGGGHSRPSKPMK